MASDRRGILSMVWWIIAWGGILGVWGAPVTQASESPATWYSLTIHINNENTAIVNAEVSLPVQLQTVYGVFTDYANWPSLFLHPPQLNTLERKDDGVIMDLSIPTRFLPVALRLVTITTTIPPRHVESQLVLGDFDQYDWEWDLHPLPSGTNTSATLRLSVKPRFWTPAWLLRWMLRSELEGHFDKLRQRVILLEQQRNR